ncbi:MAG: tRNA 4-thiouridine(8) synthase ThiI [Lachnospiraceae bacterium]|nr:tRNA 4-thiouridine(8) synthase ThiI [Lachnospiraceae bacterium]
MEKAVIIKYSEIGVKGKNRHLFEEALVRRIEDVLSKVGDGFKVTRPQGRIFVESEDGSDFDFEDVKEALLKVFGIQEFALCHVTKDDGTEALAKELVDFLKEQYEGEVFSFKVNTRRARKNYPLESMELSALMGEKILDAFPEWKVDVHDPELIVHIEIRDKINYYAKSYQGLRGLPNGTGGRAMLLLSGGIDSPVAGYMMAKRGIVLDAVYFHAPPYTSERAKQKVVDLAKQVAAYSGEIRLHVVNFTDIQLAIYEKCPHDELTIIMRRYMMRIAEDFAGQDGAMALITGESVGQVASQTIQSLNCTNEVCKLPVFRPLIGFDKQDIIDISQQIETYETSILPYEDCCTIFVAKHPVTKPRAERIRASERKLDDVIDELYKTAIETTETIVIN